MWLEPIRCRETGEDSNTQWFREDMKQLPMRERNKGIYGGYVDDGRHLGEAGILDNQCLCRTGS